MRSAHKQKNPTIPNVKSLDLNGPSGENRTHGLLNPIVLHSRTHWPKRHTIYAISLISEFIFSFCFVWCQEVSFLLWSNCGQTTPTNDFYPLLSYIAQFRFSQIEVALFYLHELSIRRNFQWCWCIRVIFSALTESYDTWLFLRTNRRAVFVLPHSKGTVSKAAVSELINRCQNLVRYPAGPPWPAASLPGQQAGVGTNPEQNGILRHSEHWFLSA